MAANLSPHPQPSAGKISPTAHHAALAAVSNERKELIDVAESSYVEQEAPFDDAAREVAIVRAGKAVEKHMAAWSEWGCFAAKGDADRARRLMELLIAGRKA